MLMRLGNCIKCTGDLLLEDDEWRCLQCGCYYYPERSSETEKEEGVGSPRVRKLWRKYDSDDSLFTVQKVEALLRLRRDGAWQ